MRILLVNWHPAVVGGVEQYLRSIVPCLLKRGHEIAFLHGYERGDNNNAAAVFPPPSDYEGPTWCFEKLGMTGTVTAVAGWQPDLVWIHLIESVELERELCRRFPAVFFAHTYDLTCPAGMKLWKSPQPTPCSCPSGAHCLALHYVRRCGGLSPLTMWRGWQRQQQRLRHAPCYRAFVVAGEHMRRELIANGIAPDSIHIASLFPPGLAPQMNPPAARPAARSRDGELLFVGRLVSVKGAEYALRALPAVAATLGRPLHLTVAGDGLEKDKLQRLAEELAVSVSFTGWLDVEARLALMRDSDLLLVPSIWPEPFGLVGVEAACLGLPAVAFDLGGIRDWLEPGVSGEVADADPPTVEGFAAAVLRALADREHLTRLRRGAWEAAQGRSEQLHAVRLEEIFARVLNARAVGTFPESVRPDIAVEVEA